MLTLLGVALDEINADDALSPDPERDELLAQAHSSAGKPILSALEGLNPDSYLYVGGVRQKDLAAIRKRLLGLVRHG